MDTTPLKGKICFHVLDYYWSYLKKVWPLQSMKVPAMESKAKIIERSLEINLKLHIFDRIKLDYFSNLVWRSDLSVFEF